MATYNSPEDVCNAVLSELGYKRRIADLNEGTPASKMFLDWYGQARDEELSRGMGSEPDGKTIPWQFSVAVKLLSAPLKTQTSAYGGNWNSASQPPPPWLYEWSLPPDYLKALNVYPTPTQPGIQYDPKPNRWAVINDNQAAAIGDRTLVTLFNSPLLAYISQVQDPTQWDANFTANVIGNLKVKASAGLAENPQLLAAEAQLDDKTEKASTAVLP